MIYSFDMEPSVVGSAHITRLHTQHTNLSDEKPDDGQCWPKHVVFTIC